MIFYHLKWNFIFIKMTDMISIPTLSFKLTCALITTPTSLCLFTSFWVNHVHMKISYRFEIFFQSKDRYEIHTVLSFILPQFIWAQVKSWLKTEVRFSTEMKSHTGLSSFHFSCEHTLKSLFVSHVALMLQSCYACYATVYLRYSVLFLLP